MDPDITRIIDLRWERAKDLFTRALALPEAERDAFLDAACAGDDRLRADLDALLHAHDRPASLLAQADACADAWAASGELDAWFESNRPAPPSAAGAPPARQGRLARWFSALLGRGDRSPPASDT